MIVVEADYRGVVPVVAQTELLVAGGMHTVLDFGFVAMALDVGQLKIVKGGTERRAAEGQPLVVAQLSTHNLCKTRTSS